MACIYNVYCALVYLCHASTQRPQTRHGFLMVGKVCEKTLIADVGDVASLWSMQAMS